MRRVYTFYWLVACFLFFGSELQAQEIEPCGQVDYLKYLEQSQPGLQENIDKTYFNALTHSQLKNKKSVDTISTIQVVFHIVYNSDEVNLPDSLIHSQMQSLNECFRRQNPDTIDTRAIFLPVAADTRIQFELAKVDPNGDSTNGIVRRETQRATFGSFPSNLSASDDVKLARDGSPAWDTDKYLNIWVCDLSALGFDALLGYAHPPTGADFWTNSNSFTTSEKQGVVIHYKVVGKENPSIISTKEKTLVHEVGHYLGLRHIWGDAPRFNRCSEDFDDFLDDTPLAGTNSQGQTCNFIKNTCNGFDDGDLPDMIENYMDYSQGECLNMFTTRQGEVMRANLALYRDGIRTTNIPTFDKLVIDHLGTGAYAGPSEHIYFVKLDDIDEESSYTLHFYSILGQELGEQELEGVQVRQYTDNMGLFGTVVYKIIENGNKQIASGKLIFPL